LHQLDGIGPGLHGGRLPVASAVPDHRRPGVAGQRGGVVRGPGVDHDDQVYPGQRGGTGHGPLDAVGLRRGPEDDGGVRGGRPSRVLERRAGGPRARVRMGGRYGPATAGKSSWMVNTDWSPVTSRILRTDGRGAARVSSPPRSAATRCAASSTFMPVESQNSTADMSTTICAGLPADRADVSSLCSLGAVYRSISPARATTM